MSFPNRPKILITWPLNPMRFDSLQDKFQIDVLKNIQNRRTEVLEKIEHYDGMLNMNIDVNEELYSKAKKLKIVANYGVGYDNIDTASAQKFGIAVSNTPRSTTNPTANHMIGLMLTLMRKISNHDRRLKSNSLEDWYNSKELGHSPEGKTLGIIGMGRIGKAVAKRAKALEMKVIYFNRNRLLAENEAESDVSYADLNTLLSSSDIISIHTPLNDTTRDIISKKELDMMKPSSYLINTARGGVINENDLITHLQSEKIAGAAIDVFENEPNANPAFFELNNVVLTPHSGTGTHEARANMMNEALGNIIAFLNGEEMTSRIV